MRDDNEYKFSSINEELYNAIPNKVSYMDAAVASGCVTIGQYIRKLLYGRNDVSFPITVSGTHHSPKWVRGDYITGRLSGDNCLYHTDIMFLNGAPTENLYTEEDTQTLLENPIGAEWEMSGLPMELFNTAYHTYLLKFAVPGKDGQALSVAHVKLCKPVLEQELSLINPKWVITLGSNALKTFISLGSIKPEQMLGKVYSIDYKLEDGSVLPLKVMGIPGIKDLLPNKQYPHYIQMLRRQFEFLKDNTYCSVINNTNSYSMEYVPRDHEEAISHKISYFASDLKEEVDRIMDLAKTDPKRKIIAVDMEWEGAYPEQAGAHLLTAQFSTAAGESFVAVLNGDETKNWRPSVANAERLGIVKELHRLLTWHDDWRPRVGGHFLRADLPWLIHLFGDNDDVTQGIRRSYLPAKSPEDCRDYGGWDTSLMLHACNEDDKYGLKYQAVKWLDVPVWDTDITAFLEKYKKEHHTRKINGFGCVPDKILHPYAAWDADATRRLAELCMFGNEKFTTALLDDDGFGNNCWRPYWLAQRAALGFLEMEQTGLHMDIPLFARLSKDMFNTLYVLLDKFRDHIGWPEFTPSSTYHKAALLYGPTFGNKVDENGKTIVTLPSNVQSLNLKPIYDSRDKIMWSELEEEPDNSTDYEMNEKRRPELEGYTAACDKDTLNLLAQSSKEAAWLRDICILEHMLTSILSPTEVLINHGQGVHEITWAKGHAKHLRPDGTVHSKMRQLLKTGRSSSSDPNLQNIGKSSEANLKRILGYTDSEGVAHGDYIDICEPHYLKPIRTIYKAPKDYIYMEADFTGAELAVMAWVSQDPTLLDHVRRNILPESDPDYYDIHSHIAVEAFRLDCPATKKGLASIGKKHLRVAAKSVVFGIPYGRGAKAISFKCRSEGTPVSVEDAEAIIAHYFNKYPCTRQYLERCKKAAIDPGFVQTLYGRCRRFHGGRHTTNDVLRKMEREFCNAPIQGTVADAVNVAIFNLMKVRKERNLDFKIAMQIHDALLLQVHKDIVRDMYQHVIPDAMVNNNPIIVNGREYRFGIETELYARWGEELSEEDAKAITGLSLKEIKGE